MEIIFFILMLPAIFCFIIGLGAAMEEAKKPLILINPKEKKKESEELNSMTLQERSMSMKSTADEYKRAIMECISIMEKRGISEHAGELKSLTPTKTAKIYRLLFDVYERDLFKDGNTKSWDIACVVRLMEYRTTVKSAMHYIEDFTPDKSQWMELDAFDARGLYRLFKDTKFLN